MGLGIPKKQDAWTDRWVYRPVSMRLTALLARCSMVPNVATTIGILCALAGAVLFSFGSYWLSLLALVLVTIGHLFDCVDGELARVRRMESSFGAWYDSLGDRLSLFFITVGITIGAYRSSADPMILIVGIFAIGNLFIMGFIASLKKHLVFMQGHHEGLVKGSSVYIGIKSLAVFLLAIAAIGGFLWLWLWFYAIAGFPMWMKQFHSHYVRAREYDKLHSRAVRSGKKS